MTETFGEIVFEVKHDAAAVAGLPVDALDGRSVLLPAPAQPDRPPLALTDSLEHQGESPCPSRGRSENVGHGGRACG